MPTYNPHGRFKLPRPYVWDLSVVWGYPITTLTDNILNGIAFDGADVYTFTVTFRERWFAPSSNVITLDHLVTNVVTTYNGEPSPYDLWEVGYSFPPYSPRQEIYFAAFATGSLNFRFNLAPLPADHWLQPYEPLF